MGFVRFDRVRSTVFAFNFVVSAAIIGLVAYQASIFLTNPADKSWIIFGLVVSVLSLLCAGMMAYQYDFRTHIAIIALLAILWLAFAAYTTDRIGYISCEALDGTTRATSPGHKPYDNVSWCRQTKAVQGLSWFNFALMIIAIISWIRLQEEEERAGFRDEDSNFEREPYRAAETAAHIDNGLRRRVYAPAPIYQQPGQPLVVQGGQVVNGAYY